MNGFISKRQAAQDRQTDLGIGLYDIVVRGLTALGMFAAAMFVMGYLYASIPMVKVKTCTPSIIDRIFK